MTDEMPEREDLRLSSYRAILSAQNYLAVVGDDDLVAELTDVRERLEERL